MTPIVFNEILRARVASPGERGFSIAQEIVIVASACERFDEFVTAGRRGELGLHFCVDGRSALRMARRFRADIWLVCLDLPDMSGHRVASIPISVVFGCRSSTREKDRGLVSSSWPTATPSTTSSGP